jgi:Na+/H+ antiporter NhaD/arsenite permease-like protein
MQAYIKKVIFIFFACESGFLLLLTFVYVKHVLSPRTFGIVGLANFVVSFLLLMFFFRRAQRLPRETPTASSDPNFQRQIRRRILFLQSWVAFLVICLVFGLLNAQHDTVFPAVVGVIANQAFMWSTVRSIRKLRAQLQ